MNKTILISSLIGGSLIGASIIVGLLLTKPGNDTQQTANSVTEATEENSQAAQVQSSPTPNTNSQAPVSAPAPSPVSSPAASSQSPAANTSTTPDNPEYCPDGAGGTPAVDYFETKNFYIYICQADRLFYHGVSKKEGNALTIPAYTEEGTGYVAENGEYTYIVNGASLTVMKGNEILQEENVISR